MANPFDIQPLGGLNLGNTLVNAVNFGQQQQDRTQQQEAMQAEQQALQAQQMQAEQLKTKSKELYDKAWSGDLNASAELYAINPELGASLDKVTGVRDEQQKAQIGGFISQFISIKDPEKKKEFLRKMSPKMEWTNVDEKLMDMEGSEVDGLANLIAGQYLNKEQLAMLSGVNKDMTTKERDFSTYLKLQKENPSNAEKFGRGAGFIAESSPKDLFKVIENESGGMIKVFRDGTQEDMNMGEVVKSGDMSKPMAPKKAQKILSEAKEYQSKAAGFAMRLRDSIDSMNALTKSGKIDAGRVALLNKALGDGSIANISLTTEEQQYIVEAKDALFAVLRPETGAAITDQELAQYAKIYLPQAGDSQATITTKLKKLENQFDSLRSRAPQVYDASRVIIGEGPSMYETNKENKTVNWTDL